MDPEKWQRVKALFQSALERRPTERNAFVAQASAGDSSVRAEVESLLASHENADQFVGILSKASAAASPDLATQSSWIGRNIGSYRIIRQIGRGGMAVVYLGVRADEQYRKHVAIKLVLPGLDNDEVLRRFRNERQTLAALDHPNIVKLLDGGNTEEGLPYLVMDYVEGVPIDQYCDARRLPTTERLQLFRQVCAAVHYAHLNLVVHRDLKPSNILVTAEGMPKLLDFGIAKLLNPEFARTLLITQTNLRLMTPEYASPEQIRGEPITPATDVYALGVILYELLTGHRPYQLRRYTSLEIEKLICEIEPLKPSTAVTRSEEIADPNATTVTTITPDQVSRTREGDTQKLRRRLLGDLDVIVLTALRKEPQRRYASVHSFSEDIRRHLEHLPIRARPSSLTYRVGKFARRHREVVTATLIFFALISGLATWEARHTVIKNSEPRPNNYNFVPRPSLAVLGFKNLSGRPDAAWEATALSEMLTTELAVAEKLRTIPGENVAQMRTSLSLPDADSFGSETLARLHSSLNADYVIIGSYLDVGKESGGQVRLELHLQDTSTGQTIASLSDTGALLDIVSRTVAELRRKLSVGEATETETAVARAALPSNREAMRLYAEGLSKLRVFEGLAARDLLQKATAADPDFVLAHTALSAAWSMSGYDAKEQEEAKKAFDRSVELSREEHLSAEGRYRETTHEWQRAIDIYKTLWTFFPDNVDYGLQLAEAQTLANQAKDALSTTEALRRLPPPMRDDPRIDLAEAAAADLLSDFRREHTAGAKAVARGRALEASLVVATGHWREGTAYWHLSDANAAIGELAEATRVYSAAGDRQGVAKTLNTRAHVLYYKGDLSDAKKMYEEFLVIEREIGNEKGQASALNNIGNILEHLGDLDGAWKMKSQSVKLYREIGDKFDTAIALNGLANLVFDEGDLARAGAMYEECLVIEREIGDKVGVAQSLNNLAGVAVGQGNLAAGQQLYEESLAIEREIGDRKDVADALYSLAEVFRSQGDLNRAKRAYLEALDLSREIGNKSISGYALSGLSELLLAEGELSNAREELTQSLAIREEIGEKGSVAATQVLLAELSIEEGHPGEAEGPARLAASEFRSEKNFDAEARADAVLAHSLLAQRKPEAARKVIDRASSLVQKSQNIDIRFSVTIMADRIRATVDNQVQVTQDLQAILDEAIKYGFMKDQFDVRLALGEIEMKSGNTAVGRAHLTALEKDAKSKGFGLIARKAAAARG